MDEYITDIKEISSKKALVYINDAPSFALYKNEADKLEIRKGYILKPEKKEELFSQILYERALNRALALIRAKDYSTFEIRQKLHRDHYPDEVVSKIIKELTDGGFLNDRRFTGTYIGFYFSSKAPAMIKKDLLKKGIDKEIIEDELKSFEADNPGYEDEMIEKLLSVKYEKEVSFMDEQDKYRFKSKVMAFLMRKGISYEKAAAGIKNYFDI